MFQVFVVFGEHRLESPSLIMNNFLVHTDDSLLGQFPLCRIVQLIDLLLFLIQSQLALAKLFLSCSLQSKYLLIPMKVVADIFEKGIEVLFNNLILRPDQVSPLYRHIVQGYEQLIQFVDTSSLRDTVSQVSASFMKFSKRITHFVQSINLVCLNSLESFSLTRDLFI